MTNVYIIRHAEAEGNLYRRIHGQYDSIVTDMGMLQIAALRKRFENIHIDAVYSSDLIRTQTTAKAIYVPKGLPLVTKPRLREISLGVWEDNTWGALEYESPKAMYAFNNDPANCRIQGGESYAEVSDRMVSAVTELAERHDGQTIALISHGDAIRLLLAHALKLPMNEISRIPFCDNTAVSRLQVEKGRMEALSINDNSHLTESTSVLKRRGRRENYNITGAGNMRFVPMDIKKHERRYLEYRSDAWMAAHGNMHGYTDEYFDLARKHAPEHPYSITEALLGDTPVGLLELAVNREREKKSGSIAFYYLREPFRAKGLGVQLIGQAVSVYRPLGRDRLVLHVAEENRRAVSFYQKYGFVKTGETDGAVSTLNIMEKDIALRIK